MGRGGAVVKVWIWPLVRSHLTWKGLIVCGFEQVGLPWKAVWALVGEPGALLKVLGRKFPKGRVLNALRAGCSCS